MRLLLLAALVFALDWLVPAAVGAQGRSSLTPSVTIGTVHDDNLFTENQGRGDFLTAVTPLLDASYETRRMLLKGWFSFDMQHSFRYPSLRALDARRNGVVDFGVNATPHVRLGLVGRYHRTDSPGDLNFESGVLLGRQVAERWQVSPSISRQFSPRTSMTARYNWTHERLTIEPAGTLHEARASLAHQTTPRTGWTVGYLGRLFDDPDARYGSDAVLLGWNRLVGPNTRLSLQAGPNRTSYRGLQPEVVASLARKTPDQNLELEYWSGETVVLGIRGPVAVHSGTLKLTRQLNRRWEIGAHAGAFQSRALYDAQVRVYRATFVAAWSPTDFYTIAGSYGAAFQQGTIRLDRRDEGDTLRRTFLVQLTVWPLGRAIERPGDTGPSTLDGVLQGVSR